MKSLLNILVISLCIVLGVSFAFAGTGKSVGKNSDSTKLAAVNGPSFIDKDGDGICDNKGSKGKGHGKGKRFRKGARYGQKAGLNHKGPNFVDKNGDGICDNKGKKNQIHK